MVAVTIDIKLGPVALLLIELVEITEEAIDLVPDWQTYDKDQLEQRIESVQEKLAVMIEQEE